MPKTVRRTEERIQLSLFGSTLYECAVAVLDAGVAAARLAFADTNLTDTQKTTIFEAAMEGPSDATTIDAFVLGVDGLTTNPRAATWWVDRDAA